MYSESVPGTQSLLVPNRETCFLFCVTLFSVKSFTFAHIIQHPDYVVFIIYLYNYKLFNRERKWSNKRQLM